MLPLIYSQFTFGPRTRAQKGLCNRTFACCVWSPLWYRTFPIAIGTRDHSTLFASGTCVLCIRKCWIIFPIAPIAYCIGSQMVLLQYKHLVWIIKYHNFSYITAKRWFEYIKSEHLPDFRCFNQAHDPSELDSRLRPLHVIQSSPLHP